MHPKHPVKGRGTPDNPANRFHATRRERGVDAAACASECVAPATELIKDASRSIISWNQSPDVPFDRSINPYRGCEHGCVYCFARPSHAYLDCSPGLDFETRIFYKPEAPRLLEKELAKPGYRCQPIALGVNTDAYQPAERKLGITRGLLEVLQAHRHPVGIVTKSALVERDTDILAGMAADGLAHVMVSVTTFDGELARRLEPRAAAPHRRLETVRRLAASGIPVGVLVAPVIPFLNDAEIEAILERAREAGAAQAGYVMLRLPREVKDLFRDWLARHEPLKAQRILHRIEDTRGGRLNDPRFGSRMRGEGVYAELIAQRFRKACAVLAFPGLPAFDCTRFAPPAVDCAQYTLF